MWRFSRFPCPASQGKVQLSLGEPTPTWYREKDKKEEEKGMKGMTEQRRREGGVTGTKEENKVRKRKKAGLAFLFLLLQGGGCG